MSIMSVCYNSIVKFDNHLYVLKVHINDKEMDDETRCHTLY